MSLQEEEDDEALQEAVADSNRDQGEKPLAAVIAAAEALAARHRPPHGEALIPNWSYCDFW